MSDSAPDQITEEQRNQIIEKVSYLKSEATMLSQVIDYVPYDERPPQKPSIFELLIRISCMQTEYFQPLLEKARAGVDQPFEHTSLDIYLDQQKNKEDGEYEEIEQLLDQIAEERVQLIESAKEVSLRQWGQSVMLDDRDVDLIDLVDDVIEKETSILSRISEQVMVYSQQRSNQREIEQRRKQQGDEPN